MIDRARSRSSAASALVVASLSRATAAVAAGASAVAVVIAVSVAGCSPTPIVLPSSDLHRPTDMAWSCMGVSTDANGNVILAGQPMDQCHPSGIEDANPGLFASPTKAPAAAKPEYRTYSYVANTDSGDLSVVDHSFCFPGDTRCWPPGAHLVDLDPGALGYSAAPLGLLPEVVSSSQDGCRIVSANRGSCDLTLVDPSVLLAPQVVPPAQRASQTFPSVATQTVIPRTDTGYLNLAPGEIAFVPQRTDPSALPAAATATKPANYCAANGTYAAPIGAPAAADNAPVPWRAVVTFPSCDLIALIELPSGNIIDSVRVTGLATDGFTYSHTGRNPLCPQTDCGAAATTPPAGDAGANETGDDAAAGEGGSTDDGSTDASATDDGAADDSATDDGSTGGAGGVGGTGGAGGAGGTTSTVTSASGPPFNVSALAIHPNGTRVYFGAADANAVVDNATNVTFVGALDIAGDALVDGPSTILHQGTDPTGAGGVARLRLSVDPFAYSKAHDAQDATQPQLGRFVAGPHDVQPSDPLEFLYVIARDGSLRVVNVAGVLEPTPFECDLAINPMNPNANAIAGDDSLRTSCFEFGKPPATPDPVSGATPYRLPLATGPGLHFPSPVQDVAFANYFTTDLADRTINESALSGAFAFVLTNIGSVYIMNIDPELRQILGVVAGPNYASDPSTPANAVGGRFPESPRPLTHSLRDVNVLSFNTGLGPQSGPPRLDTIPAEPTVGPSLKSFVTRLSEINALSVPVVQTMNSVETFPVTNTSAPTTYVYFPSRATTSAQQWTITWEGDLTGIRNTGDLRPQGASSILTDNGVGFCSLAGLIGDVLTFTGCVDDTSCAAGNVCRRGDGVPLTIDGRVIQGLCVDENNVSTLLKNENCGQLLKTFRRYEITESNDLTLTFRPKKDEVPRPVYVSDKAPGERVNCVVNDDCHPAMDLAHQNFECVSVSPLPGIPGQPTTLGNPTRRCLQRCGDDTNGNPLPECREGRTCVDFGSDGHLCAEAPPMTGALATSCLTQLVAYKLSAGNTFVVSGSASGRPESLSTLVDLQCTADTSNVRLVSRIRMNTATCMSNPIIGDKGQIVDTSMRDTMPDPDPCFLIGTTDPTKSTTVPPISVFFQNADLRFVLADIDATVAESFQIRFDVHGGASPQVVSPSVDANPGLPARLMLGPVPAPEQTMPGTVIPPAGSTGWYSDMPYLYLVDQRQLSAGRIIGRGQVLRIIPRVSDTAPTPAFEGYAAGGKYFPIQ